MKKRTKITGCIILALIIAVVAVTTCTTRLESDVRGGYTSTNRNRVVADDEIIYGRETFTKHGIAPIRVAEIRVVNDMKQDLDAKAYVFLPPEQGALMSGGQVKYDEFMEAYGENLIELDELSWVKDDDFEVVTTSKENKIDGVWFEVTYYVWGIFKKTVYSAEIVV